MSNAFDRLRGVFGRRSEETVRSGGALPPAPLHTLPREQLRAAFSLALGPGVSRRLSALGQRPAPAVDRLEQLLSDSSFATSRHFGAMLRELSSPDLLILSLLLRNVQTATSAADRVASARAVCEHLELSSDSRQLVEFLITDDLRMSAMASDGRDVRAIASFAGYLNKASLFSAFTTEEHLKALCLMTLATIDAEGALTPARAGQLWQLYADTYSYLTKAYGDELIDAATIKRTTLNAARPPAISEQDVVDVLAGLPRRYLTLFDARSIFEHVRLCRDIQPDQVHCFMTKVGGGVWELTVATLDRPFLFSNICGVLAYLNADILSGQAMTSSQGIALDVFRVHDDEGAMGQSDPKPLLADVIAGRVDIDQLLTEKGSSAAAPVIAERPAVTVDNDVSARYTVIEVVAGNAPGLLHRVSRALSRCGCEIELVVISTEGAKAHDIFHVTRQKTKVPTLDCPRVAHEVERSCHL